MSAERMKHAMDDNPACIDCVDTGCVSVCPVDCIYEYIGEDKRPTCMLIRPCQ
jgi:ferredoxin-like protein FixX